MRILNWHSLSEDEKHAVLSRPAQQEAPQVAATVRRIIDQVRAGGDAALYALTESLDGAKLDSLEVTAAEFAAAQRELSVEQLHAIDMAIESIGRFHAAQLTKAIRVETVPGVLCERVNVPITAVGLYAPAGTAPLPSTSLMLAVPAGLAGCPVRILCSPPRADGSANPAVLTAARKAGIERIFKLGGAQAIAAMAYGTASVPKCDKLFGPGNAWVTAAKQAVAQDAQGAAADMPAGPTEVLIVADEDADCRFIAADLLGQAEHSTDAQAILVTSSAALAEATAKEVDRQIRTLSRQKILAKSLQAMRLLVVGDLPTALEVANRYAPEHMIVQVREPRRWLGQIKTAGAVFLGPWSSVSTGDYCSGPNHTLPTYGFARAYSGLSVEDFQRRMTVQELTPAGLAKLAPATRTLALLEGLDAHEVAVRIRLESSP